MNGNAQKIIAALLGVLTTGVFLFASLALQRMEYHERKIDWLDDRLRTIEKIAVTVDAVERKVDAMSADLIKLMSKCQSHQTKRANNETER